MGDGDGGGWGTNIASIEVAVCSLVVVGVVVVWYLPSSTACICPTDVNLDMPKCLCMVFVSRYWASVELVLGSGMEGRK